MLPVDLGFLQELTGQALGCLAQALADATPSQRELLLEAMNAIDDIQAAIETAFEVSADLVDNEPSESFLPRVAAALPASVMAMVA